MLAASKRYVNAYNKSDQSKWLEFSNKVIHELILNLDKKFIYFPALISFLANKRRKIAVELGHDDALMFGEFCTEVMTGIEYIFSPAHSSRDEVMPLVESLLSKGKRTFNGEIKYTINNAFLSKKPGNDQIDKRKRAIWASSTLHGNNIHPPGTGYTKLLNDYGYGVNEELSSIIKQEDGLIYLRYRSFNRYNLVGDYFTLQALYDDLLASKNERELFENAAKFSYMMAHCFLTRRGSSSITEWIIRAVAKKKGITLVGFKEDAIGWQWRALLSDDINDYVAWYKQNTFIIVESNNQGFFNPDKPETQDNHGYVMNTLNGVSCSIL